MAENEIHTKTSENLRGFCLTVDGRKPENHASQALVSHVNEETEALIKTREHNERWRRWWTGSIIVETAR